MNLDHFRCTLSIYDPFPRALQGHMSPTHWHVHNHFRSYVIVHLLNSGLQPQCWPTFSLAAEALAGKMDVSYPGRQCVGCLLRLQACTGYTKHPFMECMHRVYTASLPACLLHTCERAELSIASSGAMEIEHFLSLRGAHPMQNSCSGVGMHCITFQP